MGPLTSSSWLAAGLAAAVVSSALAQTPQPFPRTGAGQGARTTPPQPPPSTTTGTPSTTTAAPAAATQPGNAPTEATLGVPLYPNAVFIRAYDAGRGQSYYLFGVTTPFADLVTYYRNLLKERGNLVFDVPPTHVFETGRFREETMAFPPSVTIKDYTFSGSAGFPNPTPGAKPERFPTIVQIVPAPAAAR